MHPLLKGAQKSMPAWMREKQLRLLFEATADALEVSRPRMAGKNHRELLETYASFTAREALRLEAEEGDLARAKQRLYRNAYALGTRLRKTLRVAPADVLPLIQLLYRNMEIELAGTIPGEVTVQRCFFSESYTPFVCKFISALDSGIMAGIAGGGSLEFFERITEGCAQCRAVFTTKGAQ